MTGRDKVTNVTFRIDGKAARIDAVYHGAVLTMTLNMANAKTIPGDIAEFPNANRFLTMAWVILKTGLETEALNKEAEALEVPPRK